MAPGSGLRVLCRTRNALTRNGLKIVNTPMDIVVYLRRFTIGATVPPLWAEPARLASVLECREPDDALGDWEGVLSVLP